MAGDGVLFTWDDKDAQAMLAKSIANIKDMTPVMKSFAEKMVIRTEERFEDKEAPDGSGWQTLSDVTKARKTKLGKAIDKILHHDGYLSENIHPEGDKDSAGIFSDRDYSAIHNRGGMAGPGRKVKIPKREFLGFNDEDIKEFAKTCKDWIVLGRRP